MDAQYTRYQHKTTSPMKYGLLLLLFIFQSTFADTEIETIQLKHRIASDVLPHVEAIVPNTAVVRAFDDKLIVKAERATIQNIIELLKTIDVAQRSLIVNVLRTHRQLTQSSGHSASVKIESDDQVRLNAAVNQWSTADTAYQDQSFKLRAISGYPVTINVGQDNPIKNQFIFVHPHGGLTMTSDTRYISADNGFKALTTLLPDRQVKIDIYPFFASFDASTGQISRSELITSVTGRTGEWLEIAAISNDATIQRDGLTTYSSKGNQNQYVYLRIDPQP